MLRVKNISLNCKSVNSDDEDEQKMLLEEVYQTVLNLGQQVEVL